MPRWCEERVMEDGSRMILCHSGPDPRERCAVCGVKGADRLCDWPMRNGQTCDRPLCRRCARHPIPEFGKPEAADIDYCPEHYAMYKAQRESVHK